MAVGANAPPARYPSASQRMAMPCAAACSAPSPFTMPRKNNWQHATDRASNPAGTLTLSSRYSRSRSGHNRGGANFSPARPRNSTTSTATPPAEWLTAVPSAMPVNPKSRAGPPPPDSAHATGTFTAATPASTHNPILVSPAPIRQAMPPVCTICNMSASMSGVRYRTAMSGDPPRSWMAAISAGSPSRATSVPSSPNPTASSIAWAAVRFASGQSAAPTNRPTRAVAPALTTTE
jgi:hypothetical protein